MSGCLSTLSSVLARRLEYMDISVWRRTLPLLILWSWDKGLTLPGNGLFGPSRVGSLRLHTNNRYLMSQPGLRSVTIAPAQHQSRRTLRHLEQCSHERLYVLSLLPKSEESTGSQTSQASCIDEYTFTTMINTQGGLVAVPLLWLGVYVVPQRLRKDLSV